MSFNKTYFTLIFLLALTVGFSFVPMGDWGIAVAFLIASAKAALIGAIFMKLNRASPSLRLMALGALFWMFLLGLIVAVDYLSRSPDGLPGPH